MDGESAPPHVEEGEREGDGFGMVLAAVEHQRYPAGLQIQELAVATIVVHHGGELAPARDMKSRACHVTSEGLALWLARHRGRGHDHALQPVGVVSDQPSILDEQQPHRTAHGVDWRQVDDGTEPRGQPRLRESGVERFWALDDPGSTPDSLEVADLRRRAGEALLADRRGGDREALAPLVRARHAQELRVQTLADEPLDVTEPGLAADPQVPADRGPEGRTVVTTLQHGRRF
jgi:hypothetical protein